MLIYCMCDLLECVKRADPADSKLQDLHDTEKRCQGIWEECQWESSIDSVEARGLETLMIHLSNGHLQVKICSWKGMLWDILWHSIASMMRFLFSVYFYFILLYFPFGEEVARTEGRYKGTGRWVGLVCMLWTSKRINKKLKRSLTILIPQCWEA